MRKVTNSTAHAPFSCHDSVHGFVWFRYQPRRDPTPFTRTCASRMAHRLRQTSIIFRLFEQSERSSSAWHTKFHGISNIQTWMWSTLHSYGFYDKFYFMPINPFIHFPMAHRWSDRLLMLLVLVSSAQLPALSQISWFSAQKPCLAQKQQHKQQQQQQQTKQQTIAKPFQNLSGLGFDWLQF